MICDICNEKNASVHLKKIINHQVEKINMCEECAMKQGISPFKEPSKMTPSQLLAGISSLMQAPRATPEKKEVHCERCGITFSQFQKIGKLGCPHCFVQFRMNLVPLLRKIHGATHHSGKMPSQHGQVFDKQETIRKLTKNMQVAAADERYEDAARIRDQIQELEKEIFETKKEESNAE